MQFANGHKEWKTLRQGRKYFGESDLDGWVSWIVLDAKDWENYSDEDIFYYLNVSAIYQGPGQYFNDAPIIRRSKTRVLVTVRCGYDV